MKLPSIVFSNGKEFENIGPKLLSDYVASETGLSLGYSLAFFNAIDWTETDNFKTLRVGRISKRR